MVEENGPLAMAEVIDNVLRAVEHPELQAADVTGLPIRWAGSEDTREGILSFQEKRKQVFKRR